MEKNEREVYSILDTLCIEYSSISHEPVATMHEIYCLLGDLEEIHCKNLFLRNSKGDKHYLLLVEGSKNPNLKNVAKDIGSTRLSFASPERLYRLLGIEPGAVSPLGLINDVNKVVEVLIDEDLTKSEKMTFHPNVNSASVTMSFDEFEKFLSWCGNSVRKIKIN